jgi:hypothetical protein
MPAIPIRLTATSLIPRLLALSLVAAIVCATPRLSSAADGDDQVVHQLRIYQLFDETRDAFHERFRDHAQRIMERYEFDIVAIWESRTDGRIEFVYLLEWPDEETMKSAWDAFMADQEWSDIKAETSRIHGQFVGGIEDRTLLLTDYSPNTTILGRK